MINAEKINMMNSRGTYSIYARHAFSVRQGQERQPNRVNIYNVACVCVCERENAIHIQEYLVSDRLVETSLKLILKLQQLGVVESLRGAFRRLCRELSANTHATALTTSLHQPIQLKCNFPK